MPSVQEILKQTGLSDEEIAALDAKAITAFSGVLTSAAQERERAEIERRSNAEFYDQSIAPALNSWGNEKAALDAELAFYKTQLQSAQSSGFLPSELPGQPRDGQGRYVAGAPGATPGSPTFQGGIDELRSQVGSALGTLSDIQWKYQSLYGKPMPVSPTELVRQADAQRLDPATYAARTFQFAEKEAELASQAKQAEIDQATKRAVEENNRKWAEKLGSNPDVKVLQPSRYAEVMRAQKAGERPDPLQLNEAQRRAATSQAIRREISERDSAA
ncbi:MAG TPA: hypothetical protein VMU48_15330 [Terracidiphilus sp.]|nr:hypothetical protein [Terracidiphilus sp.]